jgi:hypothetical protein
VVKSAKYWPEMEQAAEMFGHVGVGNLEEETMPDLDGTIKRSLQIKGQLVQK